MFSRVVMYFYYILGKNYHENGAAVQWNDEWHSRANRYQHHSSSGTGHEREQRIHKTSAAVDVNTKNNSCESTHMKTLDEGLFWPT